MDKTALRTAAAKYGTPLYLFDLEAFTARAQRVRAAFGSDVNLCYSMKANPFVLRGLPDVFRWVEVCSPGELTICERLGIPPERILYSGVNKGADDVARAVALGADLLTAESTLHFDLICAAAAAQGKHVNVLPRLTAGSQFGMDPDALADLVARRAEFPNVTIVGIHYFSGTQKRKDAVIAKELAHLDEYLTMLHERYGFTAQHVEYGPGLNAECFRDDAEARDCALLDAAAEHIRAFGEKYPLHFDLICAAAAAQGKHVNVLPRLTAGSQFGMDPDALADLVARRAEFPNVTIVGIHYFSGTQKRKDAVIAKELAHLDEYLTMLHERYGFTAQHVEYGPGLNAECFRDDAEARDCALLDAAAEHIRAFGEKYPLTIEMGRFFAAPCGTFLTGVADAKCNLGVNYAICDGGMHQVKYDGQLMGMQAPPLTLLRESADAPEPWMLCGSLCTTADVLVREAQLPPLRVGDVIALGRCGAYSVTEGVAVFLSRDMPRVALCRGGNFTLVRDRFATDALNTCRTPEDEA